MGYGYYTVLSLFGLLSLVACQNYKLFRDYQFPDMERVRNDWFIEVQPPGWVNHELQEYIDSSNVMWTANNRLYIKAYRSGDQYYSGRLKSKERFTPATQSGRKLRVEFVAKVPTASGTWPALWMLGGYDMYGEWPRCGEIDVMEWVHILGNTTKYSLHWKGIEDWGLPFETSRWETANTFITYGVEYSNNAGNEYVQFYIIRESGQMVLGPRVIRDTWIWDDFPLCGYQYTAEATKCSYLAPFDNPHELIMNIAVGGDWGGCCGVEPGDYNVFDVGVIMEIKSVKVWAAV